MNAKQLMISAGILAVGLGIGWVAKPMTRNIGMPPAAAGTSETGRHEPVRAPQNLRNSRTRDRLKALVAAGNDDSKAREALGEVRVDEFRELIEEFAKKAGMTGLDYLEARRLRDLVLAWHDQDGDAAIRWTLALDKTKDREEFLSRIIGKVAKKDLKQALDLMRQYGRSEQGGWLGSVELYDALGRLNASEMVDALGGFISTNGMDSGSAVNVPEGFDFRRTLDGFAAIHQGMKEEQGFGIFPTNLLSDWAKRDPQAAWEWLQQGKKVPFAGQSDFFEGYRSVATTADYAEFLVETATSEGTSSKDRFRTAWQALAGEPNLERLDAFLKRMPGDRDETLRDLFAVATEGAGGRYDHFKETLLRQMTPEERVGVLNQHFSGGVPSFARGFYSEILQRLGHSPEEIQRIVSPQTMR